MGIFLAVLLGVGIWDAPQTERPARGLFAIGVVVGAGATTFHAPLVAAVGWIVPALLLAAYALVNRDALRASARRQGTPMLGWIVALVILLLVLFGPPLLYPLFR